MAVGDTDKIRRYAPHLIENARREGKTRITIRVGDVRNELGVKNYSDVFRVLKSDEFHTKSGTRLIYDRGVLSRAGANVYLEFEILPLSGDRPKEHPNGS